ncbi:MAG: hypothetical protein K2J83_05355 [Clostridia bacterium]|nr:hypothetical protein [Clostridia bacterium]
MKKQSVNRVISLIIAAFTAAVFLTAFCACDNGKAEPSAEPSAEAYPRDFMCGYFLVFYDGEEALTDKNFESADAVKCYFYKNIFSGGYTTYAVRGLQIYDGLITVEGSPITPEKSGGVEIVNTFYFTPEIYGKSAVQYPVYFDYENGSVYLSDEAYRWTFDKGLASVSFGDDMSAKVFDGEGSLTDIDYRLDCTLVFRQADKLIETEFSYFNADGERVHSVTTDDFDGMISVSGEYEYVVISKKYEKADGGVYYKRSVCDRSEQPYTERVYAPYGNGFTRPVDITVNGSKIEFNPLTVV